MGIMLLDVGTGTHLGPGVYSEGNGYGLYLERANVNIIGEEHSPNFISNNFLNVFGQTTLGTIRRSKFDNENVDGFGLEISNCSMDWGRTDDWGNNSFVKDAYQGYPYMYITESPTNYAQYNWWGTRDPNVIRSKVTNCVIWDPFLLEPPAWKHQASCEASIPTGTELGQAMPNPFNSNARIDYAIPEASRITLRIYNILGQEIRELVNQEMQPGFYSVIWDGKDKNGSPASSGVYFYCLRTLDKVISKKMVMLK